ncbi:MAG: T9SS type A sorting domain-containing protein [Bacteroidales bacterium]|nr:T9SS type A sorting domain-containing protein [Bacteroidales bacterium]
MKKKFLIFVALIGLSILLMSWGGTGHYKINTDSGLSFNDEMAQFNSWITILADHASDADYRRDWDPNEAPKHYIDIDNYSEFVTVGTIPQTWDSVIAVHGSAFVMDNGILPWATLICFDSLERCFERHDWDKAVLFASDLGHYVADGHMPMHITRNYNGQYSGNNGIHSRYESTMINAYVSQINYEGFETVDIEDVNQYVFDYLYANYIYVDSVLASDNYAKSINGNTSSPAYKQALWESSQSYTIPLFSGASHALSELIYTAWVQAGSPLMTPEYVYVPGAISNFSLEQNIPNPFSTSTTIKFNLTQKSDILVQVIGLSGQAVATLAKGQKEQGNYTIEWKPQNLPNGIYYVMLKSGEFADIKKMVLMN